MRGKVVEDLYPKYLEGITPAYAGKREGYAATFNQP